MRTKVRLVQDSRVEHYSITPGPQISKILNHRPDILFSADEARHREISNYLMLPTQKIVKAYII